MLLKCWIQYVSKFGPSTGKAQFSFQSQKKAMPKNAPTSIQLCSFHMLARWYSKSFKVGFSTMWTKNFQRWKLSLQKAEEPEIKLPTFLRPYFCFTNSTNGFDCVDHNKLWKIPEEMEIPDQLSYLLRNLYAVQEATVTTRHRTMDCLKLRHGVGQGCILSPCLFNLYAEYIMWNAMLNESHAGIKFSSRNNNSLRYADDTTQMAASEEELKSLLMKVKEESGKSWLKAQHSEN